MMLLGCGARNTNPSETTTPASGGAAGSAAPRAGKGEGASHPEAYEEFKKVCEQMPCRKNVKISLKTQKGMFNFRAALFPPVVQETFITLIPGENLFVEATVQEDHLINLAVVKQVANPGRTISFEFHQTDELGDGTHMVLMVKNPFEKHLRYRLGMMLPDGDTVYATTSCPVGPKIMIMEHWPHPIFQLIFTEMRLVDETNDDLACKQ
jgi:hypothetical protein